MGFEAHRHARGIGADDAAAQDHDFCGGHARHAAQQHAASALRDFQAMRAGLDRHAAGHFAHRRQERQPAARIRHGLIGNRDRAGFDETFGLRGVGREMKIGEQHLPGPEPLDLDRLRLLHLHDHVGGGKHFVGVGQDLRADPRVHFVEQPDAVARLGLDEHFVSARRQFAHGGRRHADAIFVVLDFLGHADAHMSLSILFGPTGDSLLRESPQSFTPAGPI